MIGFFADVPQAPDSLLVIDIEEVHVVVKELIQPWPHIGSSIQSSKNHPDQRLRARSVTTAALIRARGRVATRSAPQPVFPDPTRQRAGSRQIVHNPAAVVHCVQPRHGIVVVRAFTLGESPNYTPCCGVGYLIVRAIMATTRRAVSNVCLPSGSHGQLGVASAVVYHHPTQAVSFR